MYGGMRAIQNRESGGGGNPLSSEDFNSGSGSSSNMSNYSVSSSLSNNSSVHSFLCERSNAVPAQDCTLRLPSSTSDLDQTEVRRQWMPQATDLEQTEVRRQWMPPADAGE